MAQRQAASPPGDAYTATYEATLRRDGVSQKGYGPILVVVVVVRVLVVDLTVDIVNRTAAE